MKREIKVQPLLRRLAYRREKIVPQITLSGNWLESAGFAPYTVVRLTVKSGKIIIEAAE